MKAISKCPGLGWGEGVRAAGKLCLVRCTTTQAPSRRSQAGSSYWFQVSMLPARWGHRGSSGRGQSQLPVLSQSCPSGTRHAHLAISALGGRDGEVGNGRGALGGSRVWRRVEPRGKGDVQPQPCPGPSGIQPRPARPALCCLRPLEPARTPSANTPQKIIATGRAGPTAPNPSAEGTNLSAGAPAARMLRLASEDNLQSRDNNDNKIR